jgi:hypothetical protein
VAWELYEGNGNGVGGDGSGVGIFSRGTRRRASRNDGNAENDDGDDDNDAVNVDDNDGEFFAVRANERQWTRAVQAALLIQNVWLYKYVREFNICFLFLGMHNLTTHYSYSCSFHRIDTDATVVGSAWRQLLPYSVRCVGAPCSE